MTTLGRSKFVSLRNKFRLDVCKFLAARACDHQTVTYAQLAKKFGGVAQGWGDNLSAIALRCYDHNLPLISVIVVNEHTGAPSLDASIYAQLGLVGDLAIRTEMDRCFQFDWSKTPFLDGGEK